MFLVVSGNFSSAEAHPSLNFLWIIVLRSLDLT